jgi:hypothetical protein
MDHASSFPFPSTRELARGHPTRPHPGADFELLQLPVADSSRLPAGQRPCSDFDVDDRARVGPGAQLGRRDDRGDVRGPGSHEARVSVDEAGALIPASLQSVGQLIYITFH